MVYVTLTITTVPDLVFSEMNFLRNNGVKNESSKDTPEVQRKRKRDKSRTKEEDISAFFTSARSVLADKGRDVKPGSDCTATKTQRSERRRAPSIQPEAVVHTTDSGNRQPQLGSNASYPHQKSTSYISWSESVHASSLERQRGRKTEQVRHPDSPSQTKPEIRSKRHAALRQQHVPPLPPRFISTPLVRTIGTHCRDPSQRGLLALPSCRSRNIAQRYNKLHKRHMSKHLEDSMTYASRNEAIIVKSEHLLTDSCAVSPTT